MLKMFKNQHGDTIVEVLIASAVVSLVLVSASVLANKSSQTNQDAKEHSQATQLVQSEVEMLKNAGTIAGAYSCFSLDASSGPVGQPVTSTNCTVDSGGKKAAAGTQPAYKLLLAKAAGGCNTNAYAVTATWDSITGNGTNNITMCYDTGQ